MSTVAGPAVSVPVALNTKQRESIIQQLSKVVEEYVWDPAFPRDRWRAAVDEQRSALLSGVDAAEFEQQMDALVQRAGDLLSVRGRDMGFFHKTRRKTHPNRLASHFRYCQPNECAPALTRASEGGDVLYSRLDEETGWLKVTKFPGAVGVEIANQIARAIRDLAQCKRLILDLRGNQSGGLAFLRLAGYLTPDRRIIGYSVTRHGAERASLDSLKTFGRIPAGKLGLPWLVVKYGLADPSVRVATEGLGPFPFHGRTVLLVDETTTGAGERIVGFAADEHLAPIVGSRTAGQVICSDSKAVGHDFFVRIPGRAWYTPKRRLVEGDGIEPDISVVPGTGGSEDPALDRAMGIARSL